MMERKVPDIQVIASVLRDELGLPDSLEIVSSTLLVEDLGIDSLSALFVLIELERRFQIDLTGVETMPATVIDLATICESAM